MLPSKTPSPAACRAVSSSRPTEARPYWGAFVIVCAAAHTPTRQDPTKMVTMLRTRFLLLPFLIALAIAAAGCGDDDSGGTDQATIQTQTQTTPTETTPAVIEEPKVRKVK